jgi:hypothetical protein
MVRGHEWREGHRRSMPRRVWSGIGWCVGSRWHEIEQILNALHCLRPNELGLRIVQRGWVEPGRTGRMAVRRFIMSLMRRWRTF